MSFLVDISRYIYLSAPLRCQQEHGGQHREVRVKAPGVSESPTRCVEEISRVQVRGLLWWCEFVGGEERRKKDGKIAIVL